MRKHSPRGGVPKTTMLDGKESSKFTVYKIAEPFQAACDRLQQYRERLGVFSLIILLTDCLQQLL